MQRIIWLLVILVSCTFPNEKGKKKSTEKGKGTKSDKKTNGLVKSYTSDGKLSTAITYKDGVKNGVSYAYYMTGQVNLELTYSNGKREGQSKRFYETGQLFQTTEYKNDKMHGYQKKYRENGALISESKFENEEPCLGLKEYLLDTGLKKNYPSIIITPIDELAAKGKYTLRISMSDGTKRVKYYEGSLSPAGCLHENLNYILLNEKTGIGELTYSLPPGGFIMKELHIVAKVRTLQGNTYITQRTFNLSIDN